MATVKVADNVIWFRHIAQGPDVLERLEALGEGETIDLCLDGCPGTWIRMKLGRDGRPTGGIRPVGEARERWTALFRDHRGTWVELALAEQLDNLSPPTVTFDQLLSTPGQQQYVRDIFKKAIEEELTFVKSDVTTALANKLVGELTKIGRIAAARPYGDW